MITMTVHWNKGGPIEYEKSNPVLKRFVESSGVFQVKKLFVGRGGSYEHECLKTLIEPESYSARKEHTVEKIVSHKGAGLQKEYLVKWAGYRIKTWISMKETKDCKQKVRKYEDELQQIWLQSEKEGEKSQEELSEKEESEQESEENEENENETQENEGSENEEK